MCEYCYYNDIFIACFLFHIRFLDATVFIICQPFDSLCVI